MEHFHFSLLLFLFQFIAFYNMKKVGALDFRTDRQALLSFKSIVSDPHNALSGWNLSSSHCTWFGVNCTRNGTRVQSLILPSLGLFGIIPSQLSNLTSLQILNLYNNSFSGQIPSEFGLLASLQVIILAGNSINGTIPISLSHCQNLEQISFEYNQLTGELPSELGHLPRLRILDMSINNISGAIPPTFGNLSTLTNLSLARNQISGEIPNELGHLHKLLELQLSENQLTGEIPFSVYNISSLKLLSLTQNKLVGKLQNDFGLALPNLKQLLLANNRLEGPIPSSLSNASQIENLDLSSNGFTGSIPLLGNLKHLIKLHLGNNGLFSTTELNSQVFDSLRNCTQLKYLFLNSNQLAGQLPSSVANLSANLIEFCVDDNLLTGSFPQGFEKYQNLIALSIHQNSFTGKIPDSIGKLQKLGKLTLHQNLFSGEIPDFFGDLTQLFLLRMGDNKLSGRIPMSLATCYQLQELRLAWNNLNGSIPKQLFQLSGLRTLALGRNSLTGSLSVEFGNSRQIETMDVSDNQLSGNIPTIALSHSSLRMLKMARNKITGPIPDSLANLAALESLDLSSNNLSGLIPKELENVSLQKLNFSFNSLEGEVPKNGVFANLSWDSLQGNYRLCAFDQEAAERLCITTCITKKNKSNSHLLLKVLIPVSSCIGLACALGLILALVTQKKRKRRNNGTSSTSPTGFLTRLSYSEIRHATNGFAAENLIGKGGFGSVYKAVFNATTLAVKVLDLGQSKASKSFDLECEALRNIRHRNLVKVFTSCSSIDHTGDEFKALVMEFMSNGNLDKWLYPEDVECGSSLNLTQRLNIAIDVATALDYLHHDCNPPVVHCDLKPGNVLLDEDMVAHLGDFGLARFLSQNSLMQNECSTIGLKGSIGYIAPEYGLGGKASTSGDVYSFGILLLEMIIAKKPTDEMFKEGLSLNKYISKVNESQLLNIVDPRLFKDNENLTQGTGTSYYSTDGDDSSSSNSNRDQEECLAALIRVGLSCTAHSAKDRITMREALTKLQQIQRC